MPADIWNKIFKVQYWDPWSLDKMNSQAIADFIANAAWGSGLTGSFNNIAAYLETKGVSVNTRLEAVLALNKLALLNETQIFSELIDWRNAFFKSLSDFPVYGKGWLNRSAALKKFGLETIQKKKLE
jgi:lysozyme family protein